jgi:hypothetical protein
MIKILLKLNCFYLMFLFSCKPRHYVADQTETSRLLSLYRNEVRKMEDPDLKGMANLNDQQLCEVLNDSGSLNANLGISLSVPSRLGFSGVGGLTIGFRSEDFVMSNTAGQFITLAGFDSTGRSIPLNPASLASVGANFGVTFSFFLTTAEHVYDAWSGPFRQLTFSLGQLPKMIENLSRQRRSPGSREIRAISKALNYIFKILNFDVSLGLYAGGGWSNLFPPNTPLLSGLSVPNIDLSGIVGIGLTFLASVSFDFSGKLPKITNFRWNQGTSAQVLSTLSNTSLDLSEAKLNQPSTLNLFQRSSIGDIVPISKESNSARILQIQGENNVERTKKMGEVLKVFIQHSLLGNFGVPLAYVIVGSLLPDAFMKDLTSKFGKQVELSCDSSN